MERLRLRLRMSFLSVFSSFMTVDIANLSLDTWEALGGDAGLGLCTIISCTCSGRCYSSSDRGVGVIINAEHNWRSGL